MGGTCLIRSTCILRPKLMKFLFRLIFNFGSTERWTGYDLTVEFLSLSQLQGRAS